MAGSTLGKLWCLTTYGESHGAGIGGIIDGCPAGIVLDESIIQVELDKRKPGSVGLVGTQRKESDQVKILSGVFEGRTTGTAIGFFIANEDQRSHDYGNLANIYRPGHADCSYDAKYGFRDYRGGGRASGRETAARVAGGAIAKAFLAKYGIVIQAAAIELGGIASAEIDMAKAADRPYFAASDAVVDLWDNYIKKIKAAGDSIGGIVQIVIKNVPAGLGEPVFDKLDALLAAAMMSVGAVKAVEIGAGFSASRMLGSENNDAILGLNPLRFASNNAGGILGGISTGQDIILRLGIKPIPSIVKEQQSIDKTGNNIKLSVGGRHDICAIPRIVPVLSAMSALVLADTILMQNPMNTQI